VDEVSLRIDQGELFFLLGPSGCGKTTLLRMIAGFYFPDEGRVLFDDRDMSQVPPHARRTGMVFQNYALWPHMDVRENLTFGLEMHRIAPAERRDRVEQALEMVQLREYADRMPNQLSGGQQQRVALGRALVLEPDVVLLDEPLSNLDAKLRLEMRAQIKRLHERLGLTMVYVTHDQGEALSMADRMAIMRQGRISQIGTPRQVYHRPDSRFVADFIGETNLLPGEVRQVGREVVVQTAAGEVKSAVFYDGIAVGDRVTCSIRPERLDVLGEGAERTSVLRGTVVRVFFLGDHEQYFLELADGREVKAIEYEVETPRATVGRLARLGCDPGDVVVLKDEM
jgi:iron(III) transport system ATP-binding protein